VLPKAGYGAICIYYGENPGAGHPLSEIQVGLKITCAVCGGTFCRTSAARCSTLPPTLLPTVPSAADQQSSHVKPVSAFPSSRMVVQSLSKLAGSSTPRIPETECLSRSMAFYKLCLAQLIASVTVFLSYTRSVLVSGT
jgi:hypothetical protein